MIAQIHGEVLVVGTTNVVVGVSGFGVSVETIPRTLSQARPGAPLTLHTVLVVREDSLTLFGFETSEERETFSVVQSVSGVGPRLALALLAMHSPAALAAAVESEDRAALQQVPGIGAKVASRLLLELGGKLAPTSTAHSDGRGDVITGLVELGWPQKDAERAVAAVTSSPVTEQDIPDTLRRALQELAGSRA